MSPSSYIEQIVLSSKEEDLVVKTEDGQLLFYNFIGKTHVSQDSLNIYQSYQHTEKVICASTSPLTSLQGTCTSKMFLLRNLVDWNAMVKQDLESAPVSISLHPMGTSVAIAFPLVVKHYIIVLNSLVETKCFTSVKNIQVSFSPGGHVIAVASEHRLIFYDSITCEELSSIKIQNPVKLFLWQNDFYFICADAAGTLYKWQFATKECCWKLQIQKVVHENLALMETSLNKSCVYSSSLKRTLRKIDEGVVRASLSFHLHLTELLVCQDTLIAGTGIGTICAFPLTLSGVLFQTECQSTKIIHLSSIGDENTVVAVGKDGTISTWNSSKTPLKPSNLQSRVLLAANKQNKMLEEANLLENKLQEHLKGVENAENQQVGDHQLKMQGLVNEHESILYSLQETIKNLTNEMADLRSVHKNNLTQEAEFQEKISDEQETSFNQKLSKANEYKMNILARQEKSKLSFEKHLNEKAEEKRNLIENFRLKNLNHENEMQELKNTFHEESQVKERIESQLKDCHKTDNTASLVKDGIYDNSVEPVEAETPYRQEEKDSILNELHNEKESYLYLEKKLKGKKTLLGQISDEANDIKLQIEQSEIEDSRLKQVAKLEISLRKNLEKEADELTIKEENKDALKYQNILESKEKDLAVEKAELKMVKETESLLLEQLETQKQDEKSMNERLVFTETSAKEITRKLLAAEILLERYRSEFIECTEQITSKGALKWTMLRLYDKRAIRMPMKEESVDDTLSDPYDRFCQERDHYESLINTLRNTTLNIEATFTEKYIRIAKENSDWTAFTEALRLDISQKQERIRKMESLFEMDCKQFIENMDQIKHRLQQIYDKFQKQQAEERQEIDNRLALIKKQEEELGSLHTELVVGETEKIAH